MKTIIITLLSFFAFAASAYAQITVVSTDTIRDGNQTIIRRMFSNGVEQKIFMGSTDEQLAAHGIKIGQALKAGTESPYLEFTDLEGRKVTTDDLKGKFVFIDVWATWCGPCKQEIPHLEKLQEQMKGRDITFVSISVDKDRDAWEKMAREQHLGGMQLYAGEGAELSEVYGINGIPRFILLDREGYIVAPSAIRPSNPDILEILGNLVAGNYTSEEASLYTTRGLPKKDKSGQQCPVFSYPDIDGKTVTLDAMRGKYVLIDIWATWCGPCLHEVPYMKELEEKYRGRNIEFVSISVDESKDAWEKMVRDKQMGGRQLYCGDMGGINISNGEKDAFMDFLRLNGIPRFILLDREGRVIDDEMRIRPSNPEIHGILDNLKGL